MFECLVGYPPFCSPSAHETYRKIIDWRHELYFPDDVHLSRKSEDLIRRMITSADHRLGKKGAEEIKDHVFFSGVDWTTIRNIEAPFIPHLKSVTDTSYSPTEDLDDLPTEPVGADTDTSSRDLAFLGYTFRRYENYGAVSQAMVRVLQINLHLESCSLPASISIHTTHQTQISALNASPNIYPAGDAKH
ncbi:Serine/threonine-protein kinase [Puccinia graminis f. sp. tritici]|uniref:non-specific serine/threonine protein kinase n=1 Tax=Puccinia graminis f. sp. tritici TaxID=56615 RepID=A0A5B0SCZ9_PUCGR|nr:Serine/threonine-protein kinase [Puccinia graminis f. sp. tritici]KAA1135722.1 Serine/threonine-protein kinase [Puccinia graminis f. sp. tritici]